MNLRLFSLLLVCQILALALADDDDDDKYQQEGFEVVDWTDKFDKNYKPYKPPKIALTLDKSKDKQKQKQKKTPSSGKKGKETKRKGIMGLIEKAEKEEEAEEEMDMQQSPDGAGHLAFLFLARGGLPLQGMWQNFLEGCPPGSYQVLIHQQQGGGSPLGESLGADKVVQGDLRYKYDMNRAMWHLMDRAHTNPSNTWFQFVSESCLPVRSCSQFHQYLSNSKGNSFVGNMQVTDPSGQGDVQAYLQRSKRCTDGSVVRNPCMKSSQWMTLYRPHVSILLTQYIGEEENFWSQSTVPDEHMIPTLFYEKQVAVWGHTLVYVKWPAANWPEPSAWNDGPPQEDCVMNEGHPCDVTLQDPHVSTPSLRQFFIRKINPADLGQFPQTVAMLQKRYKDT